MCEKSPASFVSPMFFTPCNGLRCLHLRPIVHVERFYAFCYRGSSFPGGIAIAYIPYVDRAALGPKTSGGAFVPDPEAGSLIIFCRLIGFYVQESYFYLAIREFNYMQWVIRIKMA